MRMSNEQTATLRVLQHHAEHPGGGVRPPGEAQGGRAHGTSNAGKPTSCCASLLVWIFMGLSVCLSVCLFSFARPSVAVVVSRVVGEGWNEGRG